jgi:hypothetical protein
MPVGRDGLLFGFAMTVAISSAMAAANATGRLSDNSSVNENARPPPSPTVDPSCPRKASIRDGPGESRAGARRNGSYLSPSGSNSSEVSDGVARGKDIFT